MNRPKLWQTGFERESLHEVLAAGESDPPGIDVEGRNEFFWALDKLTPGRTGGGANGPSVNIALMPKILLTCVNPQPAPDFFGFCGLVFVSYKFRDALSDWMGEVQYHPVSLISGSDSAKAADYMVLRVVKSIETIDVPTSNVELLERQEGGPPIITTRLNLVVKDKPYSGIFTDPHLPATLLAADAAAALSRARLSGLAIYALAGAQDPGGASNPFPTDESEVAALLAEA